MLPRMRTTLNIPDELYRAVRVLAAGDGRTVTSVVEEALRTMLEQHTERPEPFVLRALPARPGHEDLPPLPFDVDDNSAVLDHFDELGRRADVEHWN